MSQPGSISLSIGSIVWGVKSDVPRAVEFWCEALDYSVARQPDDTWAILVPKSGQGQQMAISLVPKASDDQLRQRHHMDLYATDRKAEVERLLSVGAQRVDRQYPDGADYVILADTDGNTFCVVEKKA